VPKRIELDRVRTATDVEALTPIPFRIDSLNLDYEIIAPTELPVFGLAEVVRTRIVIPLGRYDDRPDWVRAGEVHLFKASCPDNRLEPGFTLGQLELQARDYLIGTYLAQVQLALNDREMTLDDFLTALREVLVNDLRGPLLAQVSACWHKESRAMVHVDGRRLHEVFASAISNATFQVRDKARSQFTNVDVVEQIAGRIIGAAHGIPVAQIHKFLPPKVTFEDGLDVPAEIADSVRFHLAAMLATARVPH
jgi:hypothetical protein